MEKARELARFANELTYEAIPETVIGKAKELILDQLGCQLAGSTLPWSKAIYEYIEDNKGQRKESTIANYGLRTICQDAAFANANFGHALIADDLDPVSRAHLGSIIIPAALAVGEREMISGKELIKAVVVGYEIAARIGAAAPLVASRGFHSGPVFGPFGVAACTSLILGLGENQILDALGIAGSHCSGLMEYSKSGSSVNRLHAGISSYGGIRSSLLSQRGFNGPATILEGERGFFRAFSGEYLVEEITRGLGKDFKILGIGLRSYCCCGTQHAGLDAVSAIVSDNAIVPGDIREIIVTAPASVIGMVGTIEEPRDITSAQFSGRFGIALRLIKGGNGFREYIEENLRDPAVLSLAKRIKYILDDAVSKTPGKDNSTRVTITMLDGTVYEETVDAAKGSIQNPITKDELCNKFREFASLVFADNNNIEAIIETVGTLELVDNIREVSRLLVSS